ncbi:MULTISPECIES: serine/threonine-protein kinase [unclassified Nonomuraea]|uniref:serine/threonine-protein kinase n=1 Tax=unclassified Nonomuraea TaxID=2593643 RepID=UPI0033E173E8
MTSGRTVIDGRFELVGRLGSGGMGTVWRAYDLALQREVALKEVRPSDSPDPDSSRARMMRERVLREARALARLDHPNVVTIHHIVDTPALAHPWIVMELVRGRSLADRLAQGPMTPAEAAWLGRGILAALGTAHEAGICHRDVKPANVLLRPDGSPVLTDFGIAAMLDSPGLTASGDVVGSPEYIAPERLRGYEGDPASDLWSLGMLLYVAVEGRHPLRRDTPIATLAAVMNAQVPPALRAGPLENVLRALLTPDPAARPPVADLDRMLAQAAEQAAGHPANAGAAMPQAPRHAFPTGPQHPYAGLPTGPVRKRSAWSRAVTIAGVAAVGGIITAGLIVAPRLQGDANLTVSRTTPPTGSAGTDDDQLIDPTETEEEKAVNLTTPAGVRTAVAALEKASGGTGFFRLVLYEGYAIADAPVRTRKGVYDRYTYRDGQVTRAAGGTITPGQKATTLSSIDWAFLPSLRRTADRRLGVAKPTMRYMIVEGASPFASNKPAIMYYLVDEYGAGYLVADTKGKILNVMPQSGG